MKALSLTQPWASLVANSLKKIETRGWRVMPTFTGTIYIHASSKFPRSCVELCFEEPFRSALRAMGVKTPGDLPLGKLIGQVDVVRYSRVYHGFGGIPPEPERSFGDYSDGRLLIYLENARLIDPIPYKGQLGFFNVDIQEAK